MAAGGPLQATTCDGIYHQALADGQAGKPPRGHEAPVDYKLADKTRSERAAEDLADLKDCKANLRSKRAKYDELMAAGEYWSAGLALRVCAQAMADADLQRMVAEAEIKQHVTTSSRRPAARRCGKMRWRRFVETTPR